MHRGFVPLLVLLSALFVSQAPADTSPPRGKYRVVSDIKGPDGMWDYATVGVRGRRLYLAHSENISMLDLTNEQWTQIKSPGSLWHQVIAVEERQLVLGSDGRSHLVVLFDAQTNERLTTIRTREGPQSTMGGKLQLFAALADPDAIAIDSASGLLTAINGGSGDVVLVDLSSLTIVAVIHVGGKLEFPVADGHGLLYVNIETHQQIAVIDIKSRKIVRRISLKGCIEPKGLAYDGITNVLIATCDNEIAQVINARTGGAGKPLTIGTGADAVIVDESRRRVFIPSAGDGKLRIFAIHGPDNITLEQILTTEKGARLGALDPITGRIYLPSALLGPPRPPYPWPSAIPGTFHVLVVGQAEH